MFPYREFQRATNFANGLLGSTHVFTRSPIYVLCVQFRNGGRGGRPQKMMASQNPFPSPIAKLDTNTWIKTRVKTTPKLATLKEYSRNQKKEILI